MIGKIKGILTEVENNLGLIETRSGLSYQVYLTPNLLEKYKPNDQIEIYTHLQVKEDSWKLYGFKTKKEKRFFYLLTTVSGVGPKIGFAIISFLGSDRLVKAVQENNFNSLAEVPGLGKKTAMKIILELSQKLNEKVQFSSVFLSKDDQIVVDGLKSLGFKERQIMEIIHTLPKNLSVEEKIKASLGRIK